MIIGTDAKAAPAISMPISTEVSACQVAIPRGIV